jgi:hypothetical protein
MKYFFSVAAILILTSCKSQKLDISQIEFKAEACFGECPVFDLKILEDGTANYDAKIFNKQQGEFTTTIKKVQLNSLTTLIEKANFFSLNSNYSTPWTDHPTYYLTVKLKNGQTKSVKDYGPSGPDKLKKVYDLIFSLRETQDWK